MPDYMFLLDSRLAPEQRAALAQVQASAHAHGINLYLAGGAVRDLITGMPIRDLDFIVEGSPTRIVHDMEKHGARVLELDDEMRHAEMLFAGKADGSVSAARDESYDYPGNDPTIRWSTAVDEMKRRDFSINAIAISLNPASRGLLLDPTNGLSDIEQNHEVRVLSIHSFTNRPVRLLRAIRYSVRLGFKLESRTQDWFNLALQRGLLDKIPAEHAGREVRQVTREEKPIAVLQAWEKHGLISAIHPQLARRHPDYKGLTALEKAKNTMLSAGLRIPSSECFAPYASYILGRLKGSDQTRAINKLGFRKDEIQALHQLDNETVRIVKVLRGPTKKLLPTGKGVPKGKAAEARALYNYLESVPRGLLAYIMAEYTQPTALSRIRMYLTKWKPLRFSLPAGELEAIGMARGPEFDRVLEELFNAQLAGRGRNLQDRAKLLRRLAGIKPEAKKKEEKKDEKKEEKKGKGKAPAAAAPPAPPVKVPGAKPEAPAATAPAGKALGKKLEAVTKKAAPPKKVPAPTKPAARKKPVAKKKPAPKAKAKKSRKR